MLAPQRQSRIRIWVVTILFFFSLNTYLDRACIASAVDAIRQDLRLSDEAMGLVLGIFALGYALFQVPAGWFADRYGAKKTLAFVVTAWSALTALTGLVSRFWQLLVVRFLFGASEAGAFPGIAQAYYRWLPPGERGLAHGVTFSGSRLGAAISLFLMPWLIGQLGWRGMFLVNGLVGLLWVAWWLSTYRDDPRDHPRVTEKEIEHIKKGGTEALDRTEPAPLAVLITSANMFLAMVQYFASNVTFFVTLTWLPTYLKRQWSDDPSAIYWSAVPLLCATAANWVAGGMVTRLHSLGYPVASRRITAIIGFGLATLGLLLATQTNNLFWFVTFFSITTFGVDMTLSPSWAFCNDLGGKYSGTISAAMNMVGNIGAAFGAIVFPLLQDSTTGEASLFFVMAASLNAVAILCWLFMNPTRRPVSTVSTTQLWARFATVMAICNHGGCRLDRSSDLYVHPQARDHEPEREHLEWLKEC
ncbi:MAG: MFS transporter [Thermogutta sp.]|uniref:MFS transporter n=1 Tax=Thermogutta sp. TaxID=1962930 RepID=UPI0019CAD475|nr:MFS transporter [Thermogutta sp.]MBC7350785.1 MFS transporter [Thermogutta sp.]